MIDFQKIGKYKVTGKLGQGSFGVVYKGRDAYLKRDVAIKVCSVEDEGLRKRFFREAEISGKLVHKGIVTVYEFGFENGVPYLVQEMLSGEDLSRLIQRREAIAPALKLEYLLQIAAGLDYAHSEGVIHRDIKPANIRVLGDGRIKIMDFGIAKLASAETQLTRKGVTMGTASYLPPEQIRGVELDHRADVFSFGVLAYELLTHVRPFHGNTLSALIYQILYKIPKTMREVWEDCPMPLSDLVAKCLEKKAGRRFASFAELIPRLTEIRENVLAGRWPALKEVTRVPAAERPSTEPSDVLSQTAITQTARSVLEGKVGDYTISTAASPPEILRPSADAGRSTRPIKATPPAAPKEAPPEKTPLATASLEDAPTVTTTVATTPDHETRDRETTGGEESRLDPAGLKTRILTMPPIPAAEPATVAAHATQRLATPEPLEAAPANETSELTLKAHEIIDLVADGKLPKEVAKERLEATILPRDSAPHDAEPDPTASPPPADVATALPRPTPDPEVAREPSEVADFADRSPETPPDAASSDTYRTIFRPPLGALKWAGIAAAAVMAIGLGWLILGGGDAEVETVEPPAPPPPVVQPAVTTPELGAVTVTAVPWAQLTEITDALGYVQELPPQAHTPLYLELRPGRYTIQVQGPELEDVETCEVEVTLGAVASCAPAFAEPDVTDYFKETGWWD